MKINYKKLRTSAIEPYRGSEYAAGYDLYTCENCDEVVVEPHCTVLIPVGIAVEIPEGYFGAIYARSGLAAKRGLRPANCVGVIDSDYRGEICVALHNDTDNIEVVGGKERIAQLVVMPYLPIEFNEVDFLNETVRGTGGFGSTGK